MRKNISKIIAAIIVGRAVQRCVKKKQIQQSCKPQYTTNENNLVEVLEDGRESNFRIPPSKANNTGFIDIINNQTRHNIDGKDYIVSNGQVLYNANGNVIIADKGKGSVTINPDGSYSLNGLKNAEIILNNDHPIDVTNLKNYTLNKENGGVIVNGDHLWQFRDGGDVKTHIVKSDRNNDNNAEYIGLDKFDRHGNLVKHTESFDFDSDGRTNVQNTTYADYDKYGNPNEHHSVSYVDRNDNGHFDYKNVWHSGGKQRGNTYYDYTRVDKDWDGNAEFQEYSKSKYYKNGNLKSEESVKYIDRNDNGHADYKETKTTKNDIFGNTTYEKIQVDADNDGRIDAQKTTNSNYDIFGNIRSEQSTEYVNINDKGGFDYKKTSNKDYLANGQNYDFYKETVEIDYNNDGIVDDVQTKYGYKKK